VPAEDERSDLEADFLAGVDAFDRAYYQRFGRFPEESGLTVEGLRNARRRAAIEQLAEHGATPGERAAAQAALQRLDLADAVGEFPAHQFEQDDPFEED
jgi:queuine/archaeosine tRNA-ribosyltransferase